jgi:hypothetical protein
VTDATPCHYCGADYAEGRREAADALVEHLRSECPAVPERVRQSYERRCAYGNCDR